MITRVDKRIGVIYQDWDDVMNLFNSLFKENEFATREEVTYCNFRPDTVHTVTMKWDYSHVERGQTLEPVRLLYSFHRMIIAKDAHNVAGMVFSGYHFCHGSYNADILNYLNSRLRYTK